MSDRDDRRKQEAVAELRAIRAAIEANTREVIMLRKIFDNFAGVFLNAKFQFGKPTDRWSRR